MASLPSKKGETFFSAMRRVLLPQRGIVILVVIITRVIIVVITSIVILIVLKIDSFRASFHAGWISGGRLHGL